MVTNLTPTLTRQTLTVGETTLQKFAAGLSGQLIRPGDSGYDQARQLWNGAIDKHPALIIRCQTSQDVAQAIDFARSHNLPVSVRGGSHNTAGLALVDDGLVIDLTQMKGIAVDPAKRTARVEPGLTIGELVQALEPYNLITTTGTCSGTGLAGSTLGGGLGWLMGKYGLAIDNVLSFELVTAEGRLLKASDSDNPDLFWGLRGGGGNFGVITSIEYQLHPLSQVLAGMVLHPLSNASAVMRFYRDFSSAAPDELTAYGVLVTLPDIGPAASIVVCYSGDDLVEGERLMAPLRQFGPPLADLIRPMPYSELIALLDPAAPNGRHYYDTAYSLKEPENEALEALIACAKQSTSPFTSIVMHHLHGAAARVAPEATAFALREPHYSIVNAAAWETGPAQPHIEWAQASLARMQPFASRALYVNFMGHEDEQAVRDSYQANYKRLVALKNKYDPANFFHFNQNIKPTVSPERGL